MPDGRYGRAMPDDIAATDHKRSAGTCLLTEPLPVPRPLGSPAFHAHATLWSPRDPAIEQTAELPVAQLIRVTRFERVERYHLLRPIVTLYIVIGCLLLLGVLGIGTLEAAGVKVMYVPVADATPISFEARPVPQPASQVLETSARYPVSTLPLRRSRAMPVATSSGAIDPRTTSMQSTVPTTLSDPPAVVRVLMPSIEVNAPVDVYGVDSNGAMQSPSDPSVVAWYDFSSNPLNSGNAVFSGHLDFVNVGPAVFWRLSDLVAGDDIRVVLADGSSLTYQVTSTVVVGAGPDPATLQWIVGPTVIPSLTFITCAGNFDPETGDYDQRLVVRAERSWEPPPS